MSASRLSPWAEMELGIMGAAATGLLAHPPLSASEDSIPPLSLAWPWVSFSKRAWVKQGGYWAGGHPLLLPLSRVSGYPFPCRKCRRGETLKRGAAFPLLCVHFPFPRPGK